MANPGAIADISVNITGDYSDLNDSVTSAVSAAQEGAQQIASAFDVSDVGAPIEESLTGVSTAADSAATQLGLFGDDLGAVPFDSAAAAAGDLADALEPMAGAADAAANTADSLADSATNAGSAAGEAASGIKEAGDAATEAEGGLSGMAEQLLALGEAVIGVAALKEFATDALTAADNVTRATIALTALTGSGEQAKTTIAGLEELGISDGLSFPSLLTAATRMTAILGPGADVTTLLGDIANGAKVMGTDIVSATTKFDQMATAGTASARTLTSLGLSLQSLSDALNQVNPAADSTASSVAKMFKAMDETDRITVLTTALSGLGGVAQQMAQATFGDQWTQLANTWDRVMVQVGQDLLPVISSLIKLTEIDVIPMVQAMLRFGEVVPNLQAMSAALNDLSTAISAVNGILPSLTTNFGALSAPIEAVVQTWKDLQQFNPLNIMVSLPAQIDLVSSAVKRMADSYQYLSGQYTAMNTASVAVAGAGQGIVNMLAAQQLAAANAAAGIVVHTAALQAHAPAVKADADADDSLSKSLDALVTSELAELQATANESVAITDMTTKLQAWSTAHSSAATAVQSATDALNPFNQALADENAAQSDLATLLPDVVSATTELSSAVQDVTQAQLDSNTAVTAATAAQQDLNTASQQTSSITTALVDKVVAAQQAYDTAKERLDALVASQEQGNNVAGLVVTAYDNMVAASNRLKSANDALTATYPAASAATMQLGNDLFNAAHQADEDNASLGYLGGTLSGPLLAGLHSAVSSTNDFTASTDSLGKSLQSATKTISNDLASALTDMIDGTKSVGKAFEDLGDQVLKVCLDVIIKQALAPVESAIASLFGATSGAASSVGGSASGAMGAVGSAISGIIGAVASVINVISGIVTAVASVITAVEQAHTNEWLQDIEKNTRYLQIDYANQIPFGQATSGATQLTAAISQNILNQCGNILSALQTGITVAAQATSGATQLTAAISQNILNQCGNILSAIQTGDQAIQLLVEVSQTLAAQTKAGTGTAGSTEGDGSTSVYATVDLSGISITLLTNIAADVHSLASTSGNQTGGDISTDIEKQNSTFWPQSITLLTTIAADIHSLASTNVLGGLASITAAITGLGGDLSTIETTLKGSGSSLNLLTTIASDIHSLASATSGVSDGSLIGSVVSAFESANTNAWLQDIEKNTRYLQTDYANQIPFGQATSGATQLTAAISQNILNQCGNILSALQTGIIVAPSSDQTTATPSDLLTAIAAIKTDLDQGIQLLTEVNQTLGAQTAGSTGGGGSTSVSGTVDLSGTAVNLLTNMAADIHSLASTSGNQTGGFGAYGINDISINIEKQNSTFWPQLLKNFADSYAVFASTLAGVDHIVAEVSNVMGGVASITAAITGLGGDLSAIETTLKGTNGASIPSVTSGSPAMSAVGGTAPVPANLVTSSTSQMGVNIVVNGAQSPSATAREIAQHLRSISPVFTLHSK